MARPRCHSARSPFDPDRANLRLTYSYAPSFRIHTKHPYLDSDGADEMILAASARDDGGPLRGRPRTSLMKNVFDLLPEYCRTHAEQCQRNDEALRTAA